MTEHHQPELRLEWRLASELGDNPANWRRHPAQQISALKAVMAEVGWAGAVLYNERTGRLIDGHARKAITQKGDKIPVLIGDWSEEDERKILATLDPLAAMAEADQNKVMALLETVRTDSRAVASLLSALPARPHGRSSTNRKQWSRFQLRSTGRRS